MGFLKFQFVAKYLKKIEARPCKNFEKKSKNQIFEQCDSAEKCKRGDPLDFSNTHSVAKYRNK